MALLEARCPYNDFLGVGYVLIIMHLVRAVSHRHYLVDICIMPVMDMRDVSRISTCQVVQHMQAMSSTCSCASTR